MEDSPKQPRRGNVADDRSGIPADVLSGSGWVTTKVAAEALGVNPRTVRAYIERGDIDAKFEGEGIQKTYFVSIDSLYALRNSRGALRKNRKQLRQDSAELTSGESAAEELSGIIRDLTAELVKKSADAAEFRTRLELTAQAESSLREALERERKRADRLEAELQEARESSSSPPAASVRPSTTTEGAADTPREAGDAQEEEATQSSERRERSWWRRFFGFE